MAKHWTVADDAFLLTWHMAVGADFVASHDLGRPEGSGSKRLKVLTASGARTAFAEMMIHCTEFNRLAGRKSSGGPESTDKWDIEIAACLASLSRSEESK